MNTYWTIVHESGGFYNPAGKLPHAESNLPRAWPSESAARAAAAALTSGANRGTYQAWEMPASYACALCGQRIDDGKPCGCGARP